MKRGTKILLIVLGIVSGIGVLTFIGADFAVTHIVKKQLDKALEEMPAEFGELSIEGIHVRLFSGTAGVHNIHYTYKGEKLDVKGEQTPGVDIHIAHIEIGRFFYAPLLKKRVLVSDLRIFDPSIELWMDEKHPDLCFPKFPEDTTHQPFPLNSAELMNLRIYDACFALHSVRTKLDVVADTLSLTVHNLGYDSIFHYNDSSYRFSLAHAAVIIPDGRVAIDTRNIAQKDQGSLSIGTTRIANTMPKMKLGDLVREPVTWIDMTIASVTTCPFNPVRKALAKDMTLKSIEADVAQMNVFRDTRYKPKTPFQTPQQALLAIPVTFTIQHVDASIERIFIELASTEKNIGQLTLQDIHAQVDNVTNRRGATMRLSGGCPVDKGNATAKARLTMDRENTFYSCMHVTNVNVNFMSPFIRPLVGMTADCMIDTLDTEYTGNTTEAKGSFRMLYHGLEIAVHKDDDIPYKIITKNANTFTTLGNSLIPKSNPTVVDIRPRAYEVNWKYDPWQPWPLYLFGPCIDGVKKTFLPGLYVHTQINKPFKK